MTTDRRHKWEELTPQDQRACRILVYMSDRENNPNWNNPTIEPNILMNWEVVVELMDWLGEVKEVYPNSTPATGETFNLGDGRIIRVFDEIPEPDEDDEPVVEPEPEPINRDELIVVELVDWIDKLYSVFPNASPVENYTKFNLGDGHIIRALDEIPVPEPVVNEPVVNEPVVVPEYAFIYKISWYDSKRHTKSTIDMLFLHGKDTDWIYNRSWREEEVVKVEDIRVLRTSNEYLSAFNRPVVE